MRLAQTPCDELPDVGESKLQSYQARGKRRATDGDPPLELQCRNVKWRKRTWYKDRVERRIWSMYVRWREADGQWHSKFESLPPSVDDLQERITCMYTCACTYAAGSARYVIDRAALVAIFHIRIASYTARGHRRAR